MPGCRTSGPSTSSKQATKGYDPAGEGFTLHRLRHSRLTHLGEDGWSAPMLMALSGHENLRTLGIYVNPSAEAVAAALAEQDPARRQR
ncbi:site-specific integrase [Nonomuraea sp. NPDC000554]|uniref:site-specific integrase n=1 Tax=Nonomuraea sp. NPDC000554 TaxID=3154259 RepID=UPI003318E275